MEDDAEGRRAPPAARLPLCLYPAPSVCSAARTEAQCKYQNTNRPRLTPILCQACLSEL